MQARLAETMIMAKRKPLYYKDVFRRRFVNFSTFRFSSRLGFGMQVKLAETMIMARELSAAKGP